MRHRFQNSRGRLVAFNIAATGYDDYRSLSCFLRSDEGELDAGIDGFSWGGYSMVEWLWVTASIRGQGCGTRLIRAFEAESQKRGCRTIRVNTHTFQAPEFYRRLGYEEIGYAEGDAGRSRRTLLREAAVVSPTISRPNPAGA